MISKLQETDDRVSQNLEALISEQKKEQARKNQAKMEEKRLKVETNVKAARDRHMEERKKMISKLQETDDRVSQNLEALKSEQESKIGRVQEKAEENARRLEEHMDMEME